MAEKTVFGQPVPKPQRAKAPRAARAKKPKPPTKTELKEMAAEQLRREELEVQEKMQQMFQSEAYTSADSIKQKEMADNWRKNVWDPYQKQIAVENPERAQVLNRTVAAELGREGVERDRKFSYGPVKMLKDGARKASMSVRRKVAGPTSALMLQVESSRADFIDQRISAFEEELKDPNITPERRATVERALESSYAQLKDSAEGAVKHHKSLEDTNRKIQETEDKLSDFSKDVEKRASRRVAEGKSDSFATTLAAFEGSKAEGVAYLGSELVGATPDVVVSAISAMASRPLKALGALRQFVFSAAGAGASAWSEANTEAMLEVLTMPEEVLLTDTAYKDLVEQGVDPSIARYRLATQAAQRASTVQGATAFATGFTGVSKVVANLAAPVKKQVAQELAKGGARAASKNIAKETTKTLVTEAGANALDALGYNYAMHSVLKDGRSLTAGVGDAAVVGGALGTAMGAPGHVMQARRESKLAGEIAQENALKEFGEDGLPKDSPNTREQAEVLDVTVEDIGQTIIRADEQIQALSTMEMTPESVDTAHATLTRLVEEGAPADLVAEMQARHLEGIDGYTPLDVETLEATPVRPIVEETTTPTEVADVVAPKELDKGLVLKDTNLKIENGEIVVGKVTEAVEAKTPTEIQRMAQEGVFSRERAENIANRALEDAEITISETAEPTEFIPKSFKVTLGGVEVDVPLTPTGAIRFGALNGASAVAEYSGSVDATQRTISSAEKYMANKPANTLVPEGVENSLLEGLTPLYQIDPDGFAMLEDRINAIGVPREGGNLFDVIDRKLGSVISLADAEAAMVAQDLSTEATPYIEARQDVMSKEASAVLLDSLLHTDAMESHNNLIKERLSVMKAVAPKTPAEASKSKKNARAFDKIQRDKRRIELGDKIRDYALDFPTRRAKIRSSLTGEQVTGKIMNNLNEVEFLHVAKDLHPIFLEDPGAIENSPMTINGIEPKTAEQSNNLVTRLLTFYRSIHGEDYTGQGTGRGSNGSVKINSLLETYTRRAQAEAQPSADADVSGGSAGLDSSRAGGTPQQDASTAQADATVPAGSRPHTEFRAALSRSNRGLLTSTGEGKSVGSGVSWRQKLRSTDNGGRYEGISEPSEQLNFAKTTNYILGSFDPNATLAGHDVFKLSSIFSAKMEGGKVPEAQRALMSEVMEVQTQLESDTLSPSERVEAMRAVDEALASLYDSGQDFLSKDTPSGKSAEKLASAVQKLTPEEKTILLEAYEADTETSSTGAFVNEMVSQAIVEQGGGTPSSRFTALADSVREVFAKIARAIAAGVIVFSTWTGVTGPADATAYVGQATVQAPVASETIASFTDKANIINQFVKESGDNNGKPYIIADKNSGEIHMMSADHKLIETAPALYGKNKGDERVFSNTPSGAFTLNVIPQGGQYGGSVGQFSTTSNGDIFAIHRLINVPGQDRAGRLQSPTAKDNRISNGCINVSDQFYDSFVGNGVAHKVYVVPDTKSVADVFGIEAEKAREAERVVAPDGTSALDGQETKYESSITRLDDDFSKAWTEAVAELPQQDFGMMTSTVMQAPQSDAASGMVAAGVLASMAGLGLATRAVRGRRKAKGGAKAPVEVEVPEMITPPQTKEVVSIPNNLSNTTIKDTREAGYAAYSLANNTLSFFDRAKIKSTELFTVGKGGAKLTEFLMEHVESQEAHVYHHPLRQRFVAKQNRIDNIEADYTKKFMHPVMKLASTMGNNIGIARGDALQDVFWWATLEHIAEANADLRKEKVERAQGFLNVYRESTSLVTSRLALERYNEVLHEIRVFDRAQEEGRLIEGAKMAGGMTDKEAAQFKKDILLKGYRPEDLESARKMITGAFKELQVDLVREGIIAPEVAEGWDSKGFKSFVPLYVFKEDGTAPAPFDRREGAGTRAHNSLYALQLYIQNASRAIGERPFVEAMVEMYEKMRGTSKEGLIQMEPTKGGVHPVRENGFSILREDDNGNLQRYKIWFDDPELMDAMKPKHEARGRTLKALSSATQLMARMNTSYTPLFAPINAGKDVGERTLNLMFRNVTDVNGDLISSTSASLRSLSLSTNPVLMADVVKAITKGDYDTPYGKHLKELKDFGGLSLFTSEVFADKTVVAKELKKKGVKVTTDKLNEAVLKYNNAFGAMPALASYIALKEHGVGAEKASGIVLESMNFGVQGTFTSKISPFMPFINSAFQGGGNILANFGIGPGRDFFSLENAGNLAKIGSVTIAAIATAMMAREMLGVDEDDGEYIMDKMAMFALRGAVPVPGLPDRPIKINIGFGTPQLVWTWGIMMDRVIRGKATPKDFMYETAATYIANGIMDPTPGFSFSSSPGHFLLYSAMPSVLKPVYSLAVNKNNFGGRIYSSGSELDYAHDLARTTTAPVYKRLARMIFDYSGWDVPPEGVRFFLTSYFLGPLTGVVEHMEEQGAYYGKGKRSSTLHPVLHSLGANRLFANNTKINEARYFDATDRIASKLKKLRVDTSGGEKGEPNAIASMREKGLTDEQIEDAVRYLRAKRMWEKANRRARELLKKFDDPSQVDDDALQEMFAEIEETTNQIIRYFMDGYDKKRWE